MIWGCPKRTQNRSRNRCQKLLDFGPSWGPILGAFWPPGGCNMASRAPKMAPRRPRERPRRVLYASRTAPAPPKTLPGPPPARPRRPQGSLRASTTLQGAPKALPRPLQRRLWSLQITSKTSREELPKPSAAILQPLASCPASGLGGMREALSIST